MNFRFRAIAIVCFISISILFISSCAKKEDCKTCKALNGNGTVKSERTVCTEEEETAFRQSNPDNEVVCTK